MYKKSDIDDYLNRLTGKQKEVVIKHSNKYNVKPRICAWYYNLNDFYSDWCDHIGLSELDADDKLLGRENPAEFLQFDDGQIIRFDI